GNGHTSHLEQRAQASAGGAGLFGCVPRVNIRRVPEYALIGRRLLLKLCKLLYVIYFMLNMICAILCQLYYVY
ncbi:MAG: hypothetical protein J6J62_08070, partial [Oscillospiraceae bacterium]|nr:hypothetical protein [Oscillospiraceae bacterium]